MSTEVYLDGKVYNVDRFKTVDTNGVETEWTTSNSSGDNLEDATYKQY